MRCKLAQNMSDIEKMIRFYIAIFLMTLSVATSNYVYLILTIILLYTAIKKRCFLYGIFKINKHISKKQYYENYILKNNLFKIAIYENNGDIVYKNDNFLEKYEDIDNIKNIKLNYKTTKFQYIDDDELNICYIES